MRKDIVDSKSAMFKGQRILISRDLPLYKWALQNKGFKLVTPSWLKNRTEMTKISSLESKSPSGSSTSFTGSIPFLPSQEQITTSDCLISLETATNYWNILFCLSTSLSDSSCIGAEEITALKPNQKVNIIPGMRILFGRKDFLCQTMSDMRKIPCKFLYYIHFHCISFIHQPHFFSTFLPSFLPYSQSSIPP